MGYRPSAIVHADVFTAVGFETLSAINIGGDIRGGQEEGDHSCSPCRSSCFRLDSGVN